MHAGVGQAVVQPGSGAVAERGADCLVERREHLEEHEHDGNHGERRRRTRALLDSADERPHRNREHRRQRTAEEKDRPPCDGERRIGFGQRSEELPLFAAYKRLTAHG